MFFLGSRSIAVLCRNSRSILDLNIFFFQDIGPLQHTHQPRRTPLHHSPPPALASSRHRQHHFLRHAFLFSLDSLFAFYCVSREELKRPSILLAGIVTASAHSLPTCLFPCKGHGEPVPKTTTHLPTRNASTCPSEDKPVDYWTYQASRRLPQSALLVSGSRAQWSHYQHRCRYLSTKYPYTGLLVPRACAASCFVPSRSTSKRYVSGANHREHFYHTCKEIYSTLQTLTPHNQPYQQNYRISFPRTL